MFTRKHFETVAEIIKSIDNEVVRKQLCQRFSKEFSENNPKFNKELFKKACNINLK